MKQLYISAVDGHSRLTAFAVYDDSTICVERDKIRGVWIDLEVEWTAYSGYSTDAHDTELLELDEVTPEDQNFARALQARFSEARPRAKESADEVATWLCTFKVREWRPQ